MNALIYNTIILFETILLYYIDSIVCFSSFFISTLKCISHHLSVFLMALENLKTKFNLLNVNVI